MKIDFWDDAAAGRVHFHVEIAHPFTGLIVRYRPLSGLARPPGVKVERPMWAEAGDGPHRAIICGV
jgi:hypothetical protein